MTKEEFEEGHARLLKMIRDGARLCVERESELHQELKNGTITHAEWEDGIQESRKLLALFESQLDRYTASLKKGRPDYAGMLPNQIDLPKKGAKTLAA